VGPVLGRDTRTTEARVVIDNPEGRWRPGLFVTVDVLKRRHAAAVIVENEAIQYHNKQPIVFVPNTDHFEIRNVVLGLSDSSHTAVRKGLSPGEQYASANSFALKAELERSGAVCTDSH
jgi:cobalt-zinc-cadmium efflux system membrane fusion protein